MDTIEMINRMGHLGTVKLDNEHGAWEARWIVENGVEYGGRGKTVDEALNRALDVSHRRMQIEGAKKK